MLVSNIYIFNTVLEKRKDIKCGEIDGQPLEETAWPSGSGGYGASCIAPEGQDTDEVPKAMEKVFSKPSEESTLYE